MRGAGLVDGRLHQDQALCGPDFEPVTATVGRSVVFTRAIIADGIVRYSIDSQRKERKDRPAVLGDLEAIGVSEHLRYGRVRKSDAGSVCVLVAPNDDGLIEIAPRDAVFSARRRRIDPEEIPRALRSIVTDVTIDRIRLADVHAHCWKPVAPPADAVDIRPPRGNEALCRAVIVPRVLELP